jgi:hypothetical protein
VIVALAIITFFASLLLRGFLQRGLPQIGGKLGTIQRLGAAAAVPDGFSRVYVREMVIFTATTDTLSFKSLKAFLRHGTGRAPRSHAHLSRGRMQN